MERMNAGACFGAIGVIMNTIVSMKINTKNTALGLLTNMNEHAFRIADDGGTTTRYEKTMLGLSLVREWPKMKDRFASKIQFISKPFYDAYDKAAHKLVSVLDKDPINEHGTFLHSAQNGEMNTIFYHLRTWKDENNVFRMEYIALFFYINNKMDKPSMAMFIQRYNDGRVKEYLSKTARDAKLNDINVAADLLTLVLFLKYCEVETKIIPAGKKGNHVGTKYVNESKQQIEILDSTWFTTIVKSDGFTVGADTGGFFKMQPYGPNNSQRKLIWVLPYEKEGYERKAKVLVEREKQIT